MIVHVRGPRDRRDTRFAAAISTVSHANNWQRGLSPFVLGPIKMPDGTVSKNFENMWQFAKVYKEYADANGGPAPAYWSWAHAGWENPRAVRYPAGKGRAPLYSLWCGERLDYIEARKRIYLPHYAQAVVNTEAFTKLRAIAEERGEVTLFDFDGYNHLGLGMTLDDVLNEPKRKMGHAFVLAMPLTRHQLVSEWLGKANSEDLRTSFNTPRGHDRP